VRTALATYEDLVDEIVALLGRQGAVANATPAPWDSFEALSARVHQTFEIPSTTVTPIMRRLLFALGVAARPRHVVGAGTYVGYAFAWLLGARTGDDARPFPDLALGLDIDARANRIARRNGAHLGHGDRLRFATKDATVAASYPRTPIDLLYLDIDDAHEGKRGYAHALDAAAGRLAPGALVVAHDPCVSRFAADFAAYDRAIRASVRLRGPWVIPVDPCGLSIAVAT
jgi:predicted O-methyltransferase YrrM